jgi:long-chain acyl-CoA synthetase
MTDRPWLKQYEPHVPHDVDLSTYSHIVDVFVRSFKKYRPLPSFHNMGTTLTYGDLDRLTELFGDYLQNVLGLKKGDRVALMMPNILQYPIALFGALRAGLIIVNVNPLYTPRELEHQLCDSGAKAIVIFENACATLEKVIQNTKVQHVITTQIGDLLQFPKGFLVNSVVKYVKKMVPSWSIRSAVSFKSALSGGRMGRLRTPQLLREDTAFYQYTGGTTGVSKGAELTHGNIIANILQASFWIQNHLEEGKEIIVTPLPLYHIFSLTANCLVYCSVGAMNLLITNPRDAKTFIGEMKKFKFTAFTGLNTLFNMLTNHPEFNSIDFSTLKLTLGGGMAVQRAVAENWKKVTGCPIIEAYGLTETSPAACINPFSITEFNGYIGVPLPSTLVAIRDDDNKTLPYNEVGEICIKGPQVMRGYFGRPDETRNVMTSDGYLKTGDMGFMTPEGFVKIVDRKKDMILVSGFNVYPNEIEDVVVKHPKVLECAAIAASDVHSGEVVKVVIVKRDESLTVEEVRDFCRQNLTGYKVPKHVEFRKELPKSPVGKILRRELRG